MHPIVAQAAIWAGLRVFRWGYNLLSPPQRPGVSIVEHALPDLPRTDESAALPIVFGRGRVTSPVLAFTSDLQTILVNTGDAPYFVYALDMLFIAGIPMGAGVTNGDSLAGPKLHAVWMGERRISPPNNGGLPSAGLGFFRAQQVFKPSILGGAGAGGGYVGTYQWFGGYTNQAFINGIEGGIGDSPIGDAIQRKTSLPTSAKKVGFRRQMCVSFTNLIEDSSSPYWNQTGQDPEAGGGGTSTPQPRPTFGFCLGESPEIPGVSFEVSAYGDGLFEMTNKGYDFGGDADPAEVIYDILTNPWARIGLPTSSIDDASFAAASATLKAEGHGYSRVVDTASDGASLIVEILRQINAVLYDEPTTGLLTLVLIRDDYDLDTIPAFDEADLVDDDGNSRSVGVVGDVNEVRVTYTDRSNEYKPGSAIAPSNTMAPGEARRPITISYPGITRAELAAAIASRDLNMLCRPLARVQVTLSRAAHRLRPGSVFKLSVDEWGLSDVVFRCRSVDIGQLFDNRVVVDAVEDPGGVDDTAGSGRGYEAVELPPYPIVNRMITEAPRWLALEAFAAGLVTDPDISHLLALPEPPANAFTFGGANAYLVQARVSSALPHQPGYQWQLDVPARPFATSFVVAADYARELAPYDTTTGLVIEDLLGPEATTLVSMTATDAQIAADGYGLIVLIDDETGDHEFLAFKDATDLGGGQVQLNNVWRELMDTPPHAWAAGARGLLVSAAMVGRRGWNLTKTIEAWLVPIADFGIGSGGDPSDIYTSPGINFASTTDRAAGRALAPLPPADWRIAGEGCQGTTGLPSVTGHYKTITLLEEGFDAYGRFRRRLSSTLRRGDEAADTADSFTTITPVAMLAGDPYDWDTAANNLEAYTDDGGGTHTSDRYGECWKVDGFGSIDIAAATSDVVAVGDPRVGRGGVDAGDTIHAWQVPRVTAFAPSWRNLLANVRWNYQVSSTEARAWNSYAGNAGNISIVQGVISLQRATTGSNSYYLRGTSSTTVRGQTCSVTKWRPRGLTAIGVGYFRNLDADADDTGQITVRARDDGGTSLGSSSTSATFFTTNNWTRKSVSLTLPADTASACLEASLVEVGGFDPDADVGLTEPELRVGQFQANVLTNYSFESGTASWTVASGSFTTATTIRSPSANYLQGGASTSSAIYQEYAIPDGWEVGSTAFVTAFRAQRVDKDVGTLKIEAMDGSSSVLASATTGSENLDPLDQWYKRTLYCDVPEGSTKIRVTFTATRFAGVSNSGACLDEVALWLAKDAEPRFVREFDFSEPTEQPVPTTWQAYALAYPSNPAPTHVLGGSGFNGLAIEWSDGQERDVAKLTGQFGAGVVSVPAIQFARATGSSAPHLAAQGLARATLGAFDSATSFTVECEFRVDEPGFATACGLVGRRDASAGWGLRIDASGQVVAELEGGAGTKTATVARSVVEGGFHRAWLVYDATGQTLTAYDEQGASTPVSTVTGLGEIAQVSDTCHLRVGRDGDASPVLPGQIANVRIWAGTALTSGQIAEHSRYGTDPTGLITTYTRTAPAAVTIGADVDGEVVAVMSAEQVALAYRPTLTADGGTGLGVAVGRALTNMVQSFDFANATYWSPDASTTLTQSIVDMTGRPRGVRVTGNASNGITALGVTAGASPSSLLLSFWARASTGTPALKVELRNSSGTVIGGVTSTVTLSTQWQRFDVSKAWNGSTATCRWRLVSNSGSLVFDLGGIVCCHVQSSTTPTTGVLLPAAAGGTHGAYNFSRTETLPVQLNSEGELIVEGNGPDESAADDGTLVTVRNTSNDKNRRELQIVGGDFRLAHTDGAASPATTNSDVTHGAFASQIWKGRGRWNRTGLLDVTPSLYAQSAWTDDVTAVPVEAGAGRGSVWTNNTTASTKIEVGTGAAGAPDDVVLRRVIVQAREEKFD